MNEQFEKWADSRLLTMRERTVAKVAWQASREALWQTMDSPPMDGTVVDLIIDGIRVCDAYFCNTNKKFWVASSYGFSDNPTHWMIPVLPKQDV